jgi:hypothetical protein
LSSSVFSRTDTSTDSERFYVSVLDFLDHPDEQDEVRDLLNWWNWLQFFYSFHIFEADTFFNSQVFPGYVTHKNTVTKQSALARLKEKRAQQCRNMEP